MTHDVERDGVVSQKEFSLDGGKTWEPVYEPPPGPIFRDAVTHEPALAPGDPGPLAVSPQSLDGDVVPGWLRRIWVWLTALVCK